MVLKEFFEPRLAQFSFLVGCGETGQALVIDPTRRIGQYTAAAREAGLTIAGVAETHIHADFASGAPALAHDTGATLLLSGEGGPDWTYTAAGRRGVRTLRGGERVHVGRVRCDVLHTPGHTPEHLTFLVADEALSPEPLGAFTGDFIFAGDVGRPDLLETAAGHRGSAEPAARQLFLSLRAFASLPDRLLIWPGHGAGSACGKQMTGMPVTSLGYEKLTSWAWQIDDEATFVEHVLADQPDPPRYFAEMKHLNRRGTMPARRPPPRRVAAAEVDDLVTAHAEFVDVRPQAASAGFLPGSLALPLVPQFIAWAGSVLRYGMPVYVVAEDEAAAHEATAALDLIGIDDVRAWIPEPALAEYRRAGGELEQVVDLDPREAAARQQAGSVMLDVRSTAEWRLERMPDATHAPLARLVDDVKGLDRDTPLVVYCQGGARARVAVTALRRIGFTHVANLAGGYAAVPRATVSG